MKMELSNRLLIFCLMLLLAVSAFLHIGTPDSSAWLNWANRAVEYGLATGYELNGDIYPPLMTTLLFLSAKVGAFVGLHTFFGIKLTLAVFLTISTAITYYWSNRDLTFTLYCYLYFLLSSLCLSYVDILFCPPVFLAFYFISKNKISLGVFFFTLAVFIKYLPLTISPFLAAYLIYLISKDKKNSSDFIKMFITKLALPALLVLVPIAVVFGASSFYALTQSFEGPMLSAQALNANWVVTRILQIFSGWTFSEQGWRDNASYIALESQHGFIILRSLVAAFYLSVFVRFLIQPKNMESLLLYCILGHMSYFMFNNGVHENHLFLSCILAISLACINSRYIPFAITLLIISALNLIAFYGVVGSRPVGAMPAWYDSLCYSKTKAICEVKHAYKPYVDLRFLLAIFNTSYFFYLWFNLVLKNRIPAQIRSAQA